MAVRAECYARFATQLRARLEPIDDPIERVHEVARGYHEHAATHPSEFGLMFQLGQPDPGAYPWAHRAGIDAWRGVREAVEGAVLAGAVQADVLELAHLLWSGVHGIVSLTMSSRLSVGKSAADLVDPMVSALMRAHGWCP